MSPSLRESRCDIDETRLFFKWFPVVTLIKAGFLELSFLIRKQGLAIVSLLRYDLRLHCHLL